MSDIFDNPASIPLFEETPQALLTMKPSTPMHAYIMHGSHPQNLSSSSDSSKPNYKSLAFKAMGNDLTRTDHENGMAGTEEDSSSSPAAASFLLPDKAGLEKMGNGINAGPSQNTQCKLASSQYKGVVAQPNGRWGAQTYDEELDKDDTTSFAAYPDIAWSTTTERREHLFDKAVPPNDVGKLNRLVIPRQYAEKYLPLDQASIHDKGKGVLPFSRSCSTSSGETKGNGLFCSLPFSRSHFTAERKHKAAASAFCYRSRSVSARCTSKEVYDTETIYSLEGDMLAGPPAPAGSVKESSVQEPSVGSSGIVQRMGAVSSCEEELTRVIPKWFAKVNSKTGTPLNASIFSRNLHCGNSAVAAAQVVDRDQRGRDFETRGSQSDAKDLQARLQDPHFLYDASSGRDGKNFVMVVAGLSILSVIGAWCSFLTLLYMGFMVSLTLPALYHKYEDKIDRFVDRASVEVKRPYVHISDKVTVAKKKLYIWFDDRVLRKILWRRVKPE